MIDLPHTPAKGGARVAAKSEIGNRKSQMLRWSTGALSFAIPLVVYLHTLADGVYWEDSPLVVAASLSLGIAHSPGHPLFVLLGRIASLAPSASPALPVNAVSAVTGAGAVFGMWLLVLRLLPSATGTTEGVRARGPLVALVAALSFGFCRPFWHQATVAEVYALHIALALLGLACLVRTRRSQSAGWWVLGLAGTNHVTSLLLIPSALWLARCKRVWLAGVALLGALSLYLYLPLRSRLNPLVDWGDPETLRRLLWMLSAQEFRSEFASGGLVAWGSFWVGAGHAAGLVAHAFTPVRPVLFVVGAVWALRQRARWAPPLLLAAVLTGLFALVGGGGPDQEAYLLLPLAILAVFGGVTLGLVARLLRKFWIACFVLPVALLGANYESCQRHGKVLAEDYARRLASHVTADDVLLTDNSVDFFLMSYLRASGQDSSRVVYLPHLQYGWSREHIARALNVAFVPTVGAELAPALVSQGYSCVYVPRGELKGPLTGWVPFGMTFRMGRADSASLAVHDSVVAALFPEAERVRVDARAATRWSFVCARMAEYFHFDADCPRSLRSWHMASSYAPGNPQIFMNMALCQPMEQAVRSLRSAIELDPDLIEARLRLARLFLAEQRFEDALSAADDALSRERRNADAHYTRAVILFSLGRLADAREAARSLERLEPTGVRALALEAATWGAQGEWGKAVELYRKCLRRKPGHAQIEESLATALRRLRAQD